LNELKEWMNRVVFGWLHSILYSIKEEKQIESENRFLEWRSRLEHFAFETFAALRYGQKKINMNK